MQTSVVHAHINNVMMRSIQKYCPKYCIFDLPTVTVENSDRPEIIDTSDCPLVRPMNESYVVPESVDWRTL